MRLCAGGWGCRGKFCDEEMSMCDGTNSFWCEHGGSCEEIVQGEKYSCNCPDGFGGEHCEHSGAPCGESFCFHNAECLAEAGDVCQCPSEWRGSADCSLLTKPTGSKPNFDAVEMKTYTVYDICLSCHKHVQPFEITWIITLKLEVLCLHKHAVLFLDSVINFVYRLIQTCQNCSLMLMPLNRNTLGFDQSQHGTLKCILKWMSY